MPRGRAAACRWSAGAQVLVDLPGRRQRVDAADLGAQLAYELALITWVSLTLLL